MQCAVMAKCIERFFCHSVKGPSTTTNIHNELVVFQQISSNLQASSERERERKREKIYIF
jgi:hypothetical protein